MKQSFLDSDSELEIKRFDIREESGSGSDVDMVQLKKFVETKQEGWINSLKRIPAIGMIFGKR